MKKQLYHLILLCLVWASGSANAQRLDFTFGKGLPRDPELSRMYFPTPRVYFNRTLQKAYKIERGKKKSLNIWEIDHYVDYPAESMVIESEQLDDDDAKVYVHGMYGQGAGTYLVYSEIDRKNKAYSVYSQELGRDMVLRGLPVRMASFEDVKIPTVAYVIGSGAMKAFGLSIGKSRNEKQFAVAEARETSVEVQAFSTENGPLWTKSFELGLSNYNIDVRATAVADDGSVYVLGRYTNSSGHVMKYFILAYSAERELYQQYVIDPEENESPLDYRLTLLKQDVPVIVGLYSRRAPKAYGYHIFKLDPSNLALSTFSSQAFPEEHFKIFNWRGFSPESFYVHQVLEMRGGKIVFSIEGAYALQRDHSSTGNVSAVLVTQVDGNGDPRWVSFIDKEQIQPIKANLLGHHLLFNGDTVYVLYNDDTDNIETPPAKHPKHLVLKQNTYVAQVQIADDGQARKTGAFSKTGALLTSFDVDAVRPIDDNLIHFVFKTGSFYTLATLHANE